MNWIDDEKNRLFQLANSEHTDRISKEFFKEIDPEIESYWVKSETDKAITEYNFGNASEFRSLLRENMEDSYSKELITSVMAAAFKCKKLVETEKTIEITEEKVVIPEYIYTI